MARMAVPQELFDIIAHNGPGAWFPRWFSVMVTKTKFKVANDATTRRKFGYEPLGVLLLGAFALLLHPGVAHADSVSCYRLSSGAVNCIDYDTGNEWEQSPPIVGETGDGPSCVGGYITSQLC